MGGRGQDVFGDAPRPVVVGHRGAPRVAPENTLAACQAAAAAGAGWVEVDVRRGRDGALLVRHDPCTPDGTPLITLDAAAARMRGIPALEDLLDGLPAGLGVDLELKNLPGEPDFDDRDAIAREVAAVIGARAAARPWLLTSFNPRTVAAAGACLPEAARGLLVAGGVDAWSAATLALELGAQALCAHDSTRGLDAATLERVRGAGVAVMVWTVDSVERARVLATAGIDAICTNEVAALVDGLATRPR